MGPWSSSVLENAILPQNKFLVLVSEENIRALLKNSILTQIEFECGLMPTTHYYSQVLNKQVGPNKRVGWLF